MIIDLKNQTGTITLNSGHSLINGFRPGFLSSEAYNDILQKEKLIEKETSTLESFGFWEASTPNYTTYYPDVTADELEPKDEEFIFPIFRALSATVVWKGYRPIDFSKEGVLKEAMDLLVGQTINADHETALGNAMGTVRSVVWQESYTDKGVKVPAGINAEFMIDGKSNPRIARGIMMNPPSIHSNSVSVRFEWEPSHKLSNNDDFYSKLGTRDEKGNLYRLIVTKVIQFSETSLVSHGADPWAQVIKDGKINNPVYAESVYSFSTKDDKGKAIKPTHFIDYKTDLSLSADNATLINLNNNNKEDNMKLLEILEKRFNVDPGTFTEENLEQQLEALKIGVIPEPEEVVLENIQEFIDLKEAKENLEQELADLQSLKDAKEEIEKNKANLDAFNEILSADREEAKKLYQLSKGEPSETIAKLISECDRETLTSLLSDYKKEVELKFPDSCSKCGSNEITKASCKHDGEEDDKNKTKLSVSEARNLALSNYKDKRRRRA